jgi:cyclic beta-1,2-glucan synthetase
MAADVYSERAHVGRGGWTWYTGSAGWMYRAAVESILGLRVRGATLLIDPCVPKSWGGFTITLRHRSARYNIVVENPKGSGCGVRSITLDNKPVAPGAIALSDDGEMHQVKVILGA